MPRLIEVKCTWCGKIIVKQKKEYTRQVKNHGEQVNWFCDRTCSVCYGNAIRPDRVVDIEKSCEHCGVSFITNTGHHSTMFCSRSCASAGSVTDLRRQSAKKMGIANGKANLLHTIDVISAAMKSREAWKYAELKEYLEVHSVPFEFEYALGDYIF